MAEIVRAAGGVPVAVENAPPHLEVSLRACGRAVVLHLVNYNAGPGRPFEYAAPIRNLRIVLPKTLSVGNIRSLQTSRDLDRDRKTNAFVLPVLKEHDIIVISRR